MKAMRQTCRIVLICYAIAGAAPPGFAQPPGGFADPGMDSSDVSTVRDAQQTPAQLQQLVAPIALYPDALVAQILAGSTYPEEVAAAAQWLKDQKGLQGQGLAEAVDTQSWDPSVKALTEFPSVLDNLARNLTWTSSLGDAYTNQQDDVMDAIQTMRQRARDAGNLQSNVQQRVTTEGSTIVIQPAEPSVVYLPQFNPWYAYGSPIDPWPGWYDYPGLYFDTPGIVFGAAFGLDVYFGFGWGWGHWRTDWRGHGVFYGGRRYFSHGRAFHNRGYGGHGFGGPGFGHHGDGRGGDGRPHGGRPHDGFGGGGHFHPDGGAFGGYHHGGIAHGFGDRGRGSFGGGFHGGFGGGFHGGGGRR